MTELPFSQACENNKNPILAVLRDWLPADGTMLEIGAGTAQHAVYFAKHLPTWQWLPTDHPEAVAGVNQRIHQAGLANLASATALDLHDWSKSQAGTLDAAFSANTAHIVDWQGVEAMFHGVGCGLKPGGLFLLYGPFRYNGEHTAESNARFDEMLRSRDPASGIRDLADIEPLARRAGLILRDDVAMPANNRVLVWQSTS